MMEDNFDSSVNILEANWQGSQYENILRNYFETIGAFYPVIQQWTASPVPIHASADIGEAFYYELECDPVMGGLTPDQLKEAQTPYQLYELTQYYWRQKSMPVGRIYIQANAYSPESYEYLHMNVTESGFQVFDDSWKLDEILDHLQHYRQLMLQIALRTGIKGVRFCGGTEYAGSPYALYVPPGAPGGDRWLQENLGINRLLSIFAECGIECEFLGENLVYAKICEPFDSDAAWKMQMLGERVESHVGCFG